MSVIAAYIYDEGVRVREVDLTADDSLKLKHGEFAWIGLYEPTPEEFHVLQERFHLHPLAVEDALQAHQMPKVDVYGDQLFVVARTAYLDDCKIGYGETSMFVGRNHIITVRHGSARGHGDLRQHLEAAPHFLKHGADYILHAVLDFIVDGYGPIIEQIEEEVLATEQKALDAFLTREEVARIFTLRQELMRFRRILGPMAEVTHRLENHEMPCIDAEVRVYFRDVGDHVARVSSMVEVLREVLASVLEVANLLEAQRQGVITRQLAAWAAILAIPTAIAGVYGMNFEHMPELKWTFGYPLALGIMASVCVGLFLQFKRAKWL